MVRAKFLLVGVALTSLVACASISGANDFQVGSVDATESDAGVLSPGSPGITPPPDLPPGPTGWAYRRAVSLTSDLSSSPQTYPVLVVLPSTFDYAKAKPDGADLRFSRTDKHGDDLPYWIERWVPNGPSAIWVLVPSVPMALSTLQVFYGNPNASAVSAFEPVFARVQRTAGAGVGSFTATGDIDVDWFELAAGDMLTLAAGVPLKISARRIIVNGTINGDAKGYTGGANAAGTGPGAGKWKFLSAGGGGGYGGSGGAGGDDSGGGGGSAGAAYGSVTTIDMGSGGAAADGNAGANGGGALSLLGWSTSSIGMISVNGGGGGSLNEHGSGAGAGGGVLIAGSLLDLTGSTIRANGGQGGSLTSSNSEAGGGGGGGRINVHSRSTGSYAAPATLTVALGPGGTSPSHPGNPGAVGVAHAGHESTLVPGVEASVGDEVSGY